MVQRGFLKEEKHCPNELAVYHQWLAMPPLLSPPWINEWWCGVLPLCGISDFYAQSKRSIIDFDARHTENTLSNRTWLDIIPSCRTLFKQLEVINSEINNGHLVPGPLIVFKLAFVDFRSVTGLLRFPKEHENTRRISTLLHEFSSYFWKKSFTT